MRYYLPLTTELYVPRGAQPITMTEALSLPFSCGGFPGVNLSRARARGGLDDLDLRTEPIFLDGRSKITYRHKVRWLVWWSTPTQLTIQARRT